MFDNNRKDLFELSYEAIISKDQGNYHDEIAAFFESFKCNAVIFAFRDTLERGYVPFLSSNCKSHFNKLVEQGDYFETETEKIRNDAHWSTFKKAHHQALEPTFEMIFTPVRNHGVSVSIHPVGTCAEDYFDPPFLVVDLIFDDKIPPNLLCVEVAKYGEFHRFDDE